MTVKVNSSYEVEFLSLEFEEACIGFFFGVFMRFQGQMPNGEGDPVDFQ